MNARHREIAERIADKYGFARGSITHAEAIAAALQAERELTVRECEEAAIVALCQHGYADLNCGNAIKGIVSNAILALAKPPEPVIPFAEPCKCWQYELQVKQWWRSTEKGAVTVDEKQTHCQWCGSPRQETSNAK